MPRVATILTPKKRGGWIARKRIPADVQAKYARLYDGGSTEARFSGDPNAPFALVKAQEREWRSEIEKRIANIRAARTGAGQSLTPKEARAIAGQWYDWFLERQNELPQSLAHWEHLRDHIHDTLLDAVEAWRDPADPEHQDLDDVWRAEPQARAAVRPILADCGETAQFLASRGLSLDLPSMNLFLDALFSDLGAALKLLIRHAKGDYSPDTYRDKFPKFEQATNERTTFTQLFKRWVDATPRKPATVTRWRGVFENLDQHFGGRPISSVSPDDAREWAKGLVDDARSAGTVNDVWINAARTVSAWATQEKLLNANPFIKLRIPEPPKVVTRETKAFRENEIRTILKAALDIRAVVKPSDAAKRWIPWLCAYTGARVGEIAQLRGVDVFEQESVLVIRISPEAGTVKTNHTRLVPLHSDLLDRGFLDFVKSKGRGPLFYRPPKRRVIHNDNTKPPKEPYVRVRERLAEWVRKIGVTDAGLSPNHAWRHTFKQIAARANISDRYSDYITGHAPANVGRAYGAPTIGDMAEAMKQFPRYEVG